MKQYYSLATILFVLFFHVPNGRSNDFSVKAGITSWCKSWDFSTPSPLGGNIHFSSDSNLLMGPAFQFDYKKITGGVSILKSVSDISFDQSDGIEMTSDNMEAGALIGYKLHPAITITGAYKYILSKNELDFSKSAYTLFNLPDLELTIKTDIFGFGGIFYLKLGDQPLPLYLIIRPTYLFHVTIEKDYKDNSHPLSDDDHVSGDGYQLDLFLITQIKNKFYISIGYKYNEQDSKKDSSSAKGPVLFFLYEF